MKFRSSSNYKIELKEVLEFIQKLDSLFNPPLSERVHLRDYASKIYQKASFELAYTNGEKLVGMLAYYNNDLENFFAYITFLGVLPTFQGQGMAKQMLKTCLRKCEQRGMQKVGVETWEENIPVLNLYQKFDFSIQEKKADRRNSKSIMMTKEL